MRSYKLVVLETPFVNDLTELQDAVNGLVNDELKRQKLEGGEFTTINVEIYDRVGSLPHGTGVHRIACHFLGDY